MCTITVQDVVITNIQAVSVSLGVFQGLQPDHQWVQSKRNIEEESFDVSRITNLDLILYM